MKLPPKTKKLKAIPPITAPKPRPLLPTALVDKDVFSEPLPLVLFSLVVVVVALLIVGLSVVGLLVAGLFVVGLFVDGSFVDGAFVPGYGLFGVGFGLVVFVLFAPPAPAVSETMVPLPPRFLPTGGGGLGGGGYWPLGSVIMKRVVKYKFSPDSKRMK